MLYRQIGDVEFGVWDQQLKAANSPMVPWSRELYDIASPHTALLLAQLWYEAKYDTVRSRLAATDRNPTNMKQWPADPKGMPAGATGTKPTGVGGDPYLTFKDYPSAIREWRRRVIDDPDYKGGVYQPTMTLKQYCETYADVTEVHPDTGKDTSDIYPEVQSKLKALGMWREGIPTMGLKPYTVPGLDKPLFLPDHIRVQIKLINNSNWGSSQVFTGQTKTTWHDTGPTGSNADGEWNWANNGRQGAGPAGYQAIIDDDQIIISHPFNRITWHAGTTEGNKSWGAEQCREGVDRAKAIANSAAFHGAVCAAKGWEVDTHLVQHHYWYGKNCPSYIRANGLWSNAVQQTTAAAAAAKRAAAGGSPGPDPTPAYARPAIIPELDAISKSDGLAPAYANGGGTLWYWVGDRVKVKTATGRFQRASKEAERVGPDLKVGEELDVDWITQYEDNLWYYTPWGTRIFANDVVRISDIKGEAA